MKSAYCSLHVLVFKDHKYFEEILFMGNVLQSRSFPYIVLYDSVKQLLSNVFFFSSSFSLLLTKENFCWRRYVYHVHKPSYCWLQPITYTIQLQSIHFIVKLSLVRLKHDHRLSEIINLVCLRKRKKTSTLLHGYNTTTMLDCTFIYFR